MPPLRLIRLRGVRVHNLKGVNLDLPHYSLTAFSGVSGSGKSSLAFDTLYAEGQRRYIETFSPYTRQFLEKLDKPDADLIDGIPPAIAVAQRASRRSSRSTVGSVTEVHDHLALLYARLGRVICPACGRHVEPASPATVAREIDTFPPNSRYLIAFPFDVRPESDRQALADILREDGFTRVRVGGQVVPLGDGPLPDSEAMDVLVDRLVRGTESPGRRLDSIETAFSKGYGRCRVIRDDVVLTFYQGWKCAHCGRELAEPEPRLFQPNNPRGACPTCEGFGRVADLDLTRVVPDPSRSIRDGAIAPWSTPAYQHHTRDLIAAAPSLGIPADLPFDQLNPAQVSTVVEGAPGRGYLGLRGFFRLLEKKSYKTHIRVFMSRWRGYRDCPDCLGKKLRPEALAVQLGGLDIAGVSALRVREARTFLGGLAAEFGPNPVARGLLTQALTRLEYLDRIGLHYLTLDRPARTLSGGEAQRVALTSALGSGLVNTLYVLDEPSTGLHPDDIGRLIDCVRSLRDAGNTVVVVEHDLAILRAADRLVDIGPGAGEAGGRVLYEGPPSEIAGAVGSGSATAEFLTGSRSVVSPTHRRAVSTLKLSITKARGHNLRGIDVDFPLGVLCVVTGVSGSGKSTLVEETLYPALRRRLGGEPLAAEPFGELTGSENLDDVVLIDQSPIGRSGRSNPVTYLKAFDEIRKTFAATHEAKLRNYGPSRFSFNVEGGRCNACEGNGFQTIDMQFLPDVLVRCPECKGTRYRPETLEIPYRGRNIAEVLDLTAREAFAFFRNRPKVQARLRPLIEVGLDYIRLGQPASTLSGGEAQRLKLATYLATSAGALTRAAGKSRTLFLLDEPTTGLHPADTLRLLDALNSLLALGHSLIVVEHSPEVMAAADWLIDLGPGAGDEGGLVIAQGTPETVARSDTPTGRVLAGLLGP